MAVLKVYGLGNAGVNVDADPLNIEDNELRLAQNVIGNDSGLQKRPGLTEAETNLAAGAVLGGIGIPLTDLSTGGALSIYLGRGVA